MKQLFTLIALLALALPASGQTIKRQFGTTNDPTTLTNIILDIASMVGGATNGIEKFNGSGTNTTLRNFSGVGSNYLTGTTYFGGGNAPQFTNGFVTQDSIEIGGDAIMIDPGFEFIGTFRGNGLFITNAPYVEKLDGSGTNTTLHVPVIISNNIVLVSGDTQTPYATLALANTAAAAGDTILVSGSNFVAASVSVKSGVTIAGSGLLAGTGLSQPLLIVTNDNVRLEGISIQSDSSGIGVIADGPFTFTNLMVRGVNVFASTNGFIWKPESGTGANIIQGDFHDVTVNTLTNVPGGGVGFYTHTATNALIRLFNCAMFGSIDAVLAGGTGGEVQILGGTYISKLDAITSGGAHLLVVGAKARGIDQEDLFEDGGTLTALWVDYLNSAGNISGAHRIPTQLIVSGAVTSPNFTNSSLSDALVAVDANGKEVEVVIGSGLSYTTATRTLANTGGAGSGDTNGISYVDGSLLMPAISVGRDAGDNHLLTAWWTNNVRALVLTNSIGGDSSIYFRFMNGFIPLYMREGGSVALNGEVDFTIHAGSILALQANLNTRTLNNTNGTTVLDFSGDDVTADSFIATTATFASAIGNASGLTNQIYVPTASTLFETNAAILTNIVSTLILTNHVRFTNWAAIAVSGQWFQVCLTNSTGNNYYVDVPTNGFTRALTNATGSYVVADASGTNFACLVTNGQRAVLSGKFVGGNLNAGFFHFRHW